ncbi:MAG: hypothetical protein WD066_18255 [Planctomycetaceae bacterium]
MHDSDDIFTQFLGREVVLDVTSQYVFLGTLVAIDRDALVLEEADVHDLRDTQTNRERYVLEARRHGIRANRRRVVVRRDEVVGLSALADVVD